MQSSHPSAPTTAAAAKPAVPAAVLPGTSQPGEPPQPSHKPSSIIPVCRPLLPPVENLVPYLQKADAARYYTNHGQLTEELARRLGEFFGVGSSGVVLASSGTAALVGALLATAGRAAPGRSLCICPAYTFVATAIAAANCGYVPLLADVDPGSWALNPGDVARLPQLKDVGVVLVVAPCGRAPDIAAWDAFHRETGIPVVIDAAACFDTIDTTQLWASSLPVVVSLHATKTMSTAEGGLILSRDAEVVHKATRALNFGFYENQESVGPSTNGKLSEYHAAVGLADLDGWATKRAGFIKVAADYRAAAMLQGIGDRIIVDDRHANPYALFMARDAAHGARLETALRDNGVDTRKWYGLGLHRQPEFRDCPRMPLPVTDDLASRLIGLPCACDLDAGDIRDIVRLAAEA